MKIIYHIEKGSFLVLQDLDAVYPALFDLLNQNFLYLENNKRIAKIAVGNETRSTVSVHKNFWCVILTEEKKMLLENPPLLNRFEKHNLSFDLLFYNIYCGNPIQIFGIVQRLEQFFKNICNIMKAEYNFSLNIENQLINIGSDVIKGLIYEKFVPKDRYEEISFHTLDKQILVLLSNTFSQDFIVFLALAYKY